MKKSLSAFSAVALSVLLAATSVMPANAMPVPNFDPVRNAQSPAGGEIQQVQYRSHHRPPRPRPGYWHGHRGYRHSRPGYRRHSDGWWYPLAAFTAGAIIGGAVAHPPRASSHVQWCADRYKTYRASDNTYQPTSGPRRQCVSP
jgi:hypothetical protein